jgi:hypothetical protein
MLFVRMAYNLMHYSGYHLTNKINSLCFFHPKFFRFKGWTCLVCIKFNASTAKSGANSGGVSIETGLPDSNKSQGSLRLKPKKTVILN